MIRVCLIVEGGHLSEDSRYELTQHLTLMAIPVSLELEFADGGGRKVSGMPKHKEPHLYYQRAREDTVKRAIKKHAPDVILHWNKNLRFTRGGIADWARFTIENSPGLVTAPIEISIDLSREAKLSSETLSSLKSREDQGLRRITYYGGNFKLRSEPTLSAGLSIEGDTTPINDKPECRMAVMPYAFAYTPKTLEQFGGWNLNYEFPGDSELGISLRAWFANCPIWVLPRNFATVTINSETQPIKVIDRAKAMQYALRVVFEDSSWRLLWEPWFRRFMPEIQIDPNRDKIAVKQRQMFLRCKQRRDGEFLQDILKVHFPERREIRATATRALYAVKSGLGNALLCVPAMKALHNLSGSPIDVLDSGLSQSGTRTLLESQPFVRKVLTAEPTDLSSYRYLIGSYWAKAPLFPPEGALYANASRDSLYMHEVESNMLPVRALGFRGVTPSIEIQVPPISRADLPPEYVVVGIGYSGYRMKKYPHWKSVSESLAEAGLALVFLGTIKDHEPWIPECGLDLFDQTTVMEAASIIGKAQLFLGIDNGLSHLAAAVKTGAILLYGPTSERKNRPWTTNCRILRSDRYACEPCWGHPLARYCNYDDDAKRPCLNSIDPECVVDEVLQALNTPAWKVARAEERFYSDNVVHLTREFVVVLEMLKQHPIHTVVVTSSRSLQWVEALVASMGGRLIVHCFLSQWSEKEREIARLRTGQIQMAVHKDYSQSASILSSLRGSVDLLLVTPPEEESDLSLMEQMALVRPGGFILIEQDPNCEANSPTGFTQTSRGFEYEATLGFGNKRKILLFRKRRMVGYE